MDHTLIRVDTASFCRELGRRLALKKVSSHSEFVKLKNDLCRELKPDVYPSIIQVLAYASDSDYDKLRFLQTKPSRTIAGVAPVAIMTKPIPCPHGKCTMCPGGVGSAFGNTPQSYTGNEPAALRACRNMYDPYLQVFNRLEQYTLLNQSIDKIELIVMGGTFIAADKSYRDEFVKYAFKAMNDFSGMFYTDELDFPKFKKFFELPADVKDADRTRRLHGKILALKKDCSLEEEQRRNETSRARCVALCFETRPDYSKKKEIDAMLRLGCTRVELGVQSIYDDVLKKIRRGHTVADSILATQLLRDSFLKMGYHIMPGLPGSSAKKDVQMFKEIFSDPDYMPDSLKIYPCMVTKGTQLYDEWKSGKFVPLTTKEAAEIIAEGKRYVKPFCRVMRVQRDIPSKLIEAGVGITNLRQEVEKLMKNAKCQCIRCREPKGKKVDVAGLKTKRFDYEASNGREVFLSVEEPKQDIIVGFCRLRMPYEPFRKEIAPNTSGIRQLHVYSESIALGEKPKERQMQHRGFGKLLMEEAEKIAKEEFDAKKMLVLSGIGAKEYFRKLGYKDEGVYVGKKL